MTDALLKALDPLPYPRRMRELAARARVLSASGELRPVLDELNRGGPYERGIAAVAAAVGGDAEWTAAHLADPDPFVQGHALRVARSLGIPDEIYERVLDDLPRTARRRLLRAVVHDGRTGLAVRLLERVRADWGDAEAAVLLPGCPADTVTRLLPELLYAVRGWSALGRRHPGPLLDAVERQLAELPEPQRPEWWRRYAPGIAATAAARPARVLDLLDRFGPATLPWPLARRLGALAAADPARTARLLLCPETRPMLERGARGVPDGVLFRLARTAPEELVVELGRAMAQDSAGLARLLTALPPGRRTALHTAVTAGRGPGGSAVDAALLDALPRSGVADEARRMAARAAERGEDWHTVLLAESYLPAAEVRDRLLAATRRPAAADRALVWPLLVRNAGRTGAPGPVAVLLDDMAGLRNEQDPVRSAALLALAGIPAGLFTEAMEPALDRIAADAVEARDSSHATRHALSTLAVRLLREHAVTGRRAPDPGDACPSAGRRQGLVSWSLRTLVRISGNTGGADLGRLDRTLRRGQEHDVFEALRPWLEAGAEKSDYGLAFALVRALGRRAAGLPELQDLLWQAIRFGSVTTARTAVRLWLEPDADRGARVEQLLALDPSAGTLPEVQAVLTRTRTDLLDPYLATPPPHGRFLTPGRPWTVHPGPEIRRWVPRQHRAAERALRHAARDGKLPLHGRARAVAALARVPGTGAEALGEWTGCDDVVLAEAALTALGHTDRAPEVLPTLLAHAGDDRARVAVFAAGRASRDVRPSVLAPMLRARLAPGTGKVTSRKEAVRLAVARLPRRAAADLVTEGYAHPGQHPDVRAACVAGAIELLGDARMWRLLADAAAGPAVLRTAVLRVRPMDLPGAHRTGYARLVREVCGTDDEELAAAAHAVVARWIPWEPGICEVLAAATTDLARRRSWRSAAEALAGAAPAASGEAAQALLGALGTLTDSVAMDDAGSDRDRPERQRAVHLVNRLASAAGTRPDAALRPVLAAAGDLLARHRDYVPQAAELLAGAVDPAGDADALHAALDRVALLVTGRPVLAARVALRYATCHGVPQDEAGAATLLEVAGRLAEDGGLAHGLLAVRLVAAGGRHTGWTGPWRTQLRLLRRHPEAEVRDAAYAEVTVRE
ncbi:hypothetical protein FKN01_12000 [Streptomyces sp. 130]|uniref:hypothetical protein n=1 Tax=Streptomyces sp. 130 TaxID=2591006 RepID=UPI00117C37AE|nr:hypothetical protein [Streptomyces sp. 130]TRV78897.1 hypothetical protein FKN01_12000 [Streptomyces sp. 130]